VKLHVVKTSEGIIDTEKERSRIEKAFEDDPEIKGKLNELMDAVEAMDWKLAKELLANKWWNGRDKQQECHRREFIGMIKIKDPVSGEPAFGFDIWSNYDELIWAMTDPEDSKHYKIEVVK